MNDLVFLTGAHGFLGTYVMRELHERGLRVLTAGRSDCDLTLDLADLPALDDALTDVAPRFVMNLAALSSIYDCMQRPQLAAVVNSQAPRRIARTPGRLLQVSTDLVFGGDQAPYSRRSLPRPLSVYGVTKLAGENVENDRAIVVRVPLLFGPSPDGMRGATDMLRRAQIAQQPVTLFTNEYRTPLHVADAATGLVDLLLEEDRVGVLHLGGHERLSRFDLGQRFARAAGIDDRWVQAGTNDDPRRPTDVSLIGDWLPQRSLDVALAES